MNKARIRSDPKSLREWQSILLQEKPIEMVISKILEPKFTKELVSITIPKTIIEVGKSDLQNMLIDRFI